MNTPSALPFQLTEFPPERFQLLDLLGQGGMGKVYKARDRHLNRPVALKFILAQETPNLLIRLVLEAQYQASLDHPHIAKVYGVGTWEGRTCVVMQLIHGSSLDQIAPTLSISDRVQLLVQAARGMHAAHLHGLIHRDLKPQNILVETRTGGALHAFVMDFGLARATEADSLTISGAILGSPHYMSPEQAMGGRLVDARSDIYSLGATLYAAVVGAPPFGTSSSSDSTQQETKLAEAGMAVPEPLLEAAARPPIPRPGAHALTILRRVMDDAPVPPRQLNAQIPQDLETIILRCLEKDPAHRYPSAEALAEDLERFLGGHPITARRAPLPRRLRTWSRRNPRLTSIIGAGIAVGVLALILGGLSIRHARQKTEIATHFEQAAHQVEIRFRMGALSPQQNRASEVTKLLAQMEAKQAEARQFGPLALGPSAFFQGRALWLLGRNREALKELQRARDLGFRSPKATQALGSALLEVFVEESQRLVGGRSQREADREILAQKYLRPAVECFQATKGEGDRKNLYAAQIAYLEGREEAALELASAELEATPWTIEAHWLRHLVWAGRAEKALDLATFETYAKEAEARLQTLVDVGRGDPRSHLTAARWWLFKGGRLAFRFGSNRPQLIQTALDLAGEAAKLDPTSSAPYALRAEIWGRMGDLLRLEDRPLPELKRCYDEALWEADRTLQREPDSQMALLSKGYTKLFRTEAGLGAGEQDLQEALAHADRVIRINDRAAEAFRLKSMIHRFKARRIALTGGDNRALLQAWAASSKESLLLWPAAIDHQINTCLALQRLALSDANAGDPKLARAHMREARGILERDPGHATLPPNLRLLEISLTRMEGALEGLLGHTPAPAFERAAAAMAAVPTELLGHPDYIDEHFTLSYERTTLALDQGQDISPQLAALQTLLDDWVKAKRSRPWFTANQIMLWRLRGLHKYRTGSHSPHWAAEGLKRIQSEQQRALTRMPEVWAGMEGALLIQSALGSRGTPRKALLARGREQLKIAFALDDSLRWTFRQEYALAEGK